MRFKWSLISDERLLGTRMLEVEGGTNVECMRILRHEAGHASFAAAPSRSFQIQHSPEP